MPTKVLILADKNPILETGGSCIRTMLFARYFAKKYTVDLLYNKSTSANTDEKAIFDSVKFIKLEPDIYSSNFIFKIKARLQVAAWCLKSRYSHNYKTKLLNFIEENDYDIVFIRYLIDAQYFLKYAKKSRRLVIIDIDDLLSDALYSLVYQVKTNYIFKKWIDKFLLERYEKQCLRNFKALIVCSQDDREKFISHDTKYKNHCHVVPNVLNSKVLKRESDNNGFSSSDSILFVGSLSYWVNQEGLEWFIKNVFLDFSKIYSQVRLDVVGRAPSTEIKSMCEHPNIMLHANVPSVIPFYKKCKIVVVPVLRGSGTRIKILEAAIMRRPVFSTVVGAEGLDFDSERDYFAFKDRSSFERNWKQIKDKNLYEQRVQNAYDKIDKSFGLTSFEDSMDTVLNSCKG